MDPVLQQTFFDTLLSVAFVSPIVVGLVELAKKMSFPKRYIPLLSLVLGMLLVGGLKGFSVVTLVAGIALGLSAVGLFELGSRTAGIK